jgi:hypothetical protein
MTKMTKQRFPLVEFPANGSFRRESEIMMGSGLKKYAVCGVAPPASDPRRFPPLLVPELSH